MVHLTLKLRKPLSYKDVERCSTCPVFMTQFQPPMKPYETGLANWPNLKTNWALSFKNLTTQCLLWIIRPLRWKPPKNWANLWRRNRERKWQNIIKIRHENPNICLLCLGFRLDRASITISERQEWSGGKEKRKNGKETLSSEIWYVQIATKKLKGIKKSIDSRIDTQNK